MTVDEHITLACRNEDLFKKLAEKPITTYDWAITVMFYSALHFVDAILLKGYNVTPEGHTTTTDKNGKRRIGRNDHVKNYLKYPNTLSGNYRMLYDASRRARYEGDYRDPTSVGTYQDLLYKEFTPLRQFFRQHFKR